MGSYACMEQVYLAISGEGFGVYLGNRSCPLGPNAGGAELRSDNPMGSVVLLPKVCNDAISSHLQVSQISNCTSAKDAQMAQRCAYMNATFMPHATFTQHASRAWLGLPAELSLCGFSTSDMSQRYCQTQNNSDPCCTLPLARNPFASWNAVTQRWTLGSAPTPPQPSAPGSPNAGLIAGVAGSCVVALAVAGVAGFMHYRRRPKVEDMAVDRAGASNMTPGLKPLEDAAVKDQLDGYGSFGRDELMDAFSNLSGDEGLPSGNEAGGLVADPLLFGGQNFLSPLTAASSAWSTEQRSPRRGSKSSGSS
ncbi:hypothetical protein BC830DRAFT_1175864 [Chytriomyces sp. MP71]|nr:hypothetical protein BC830DRAFT_1175864 [Chytriomyces sp. MP71]